MKTPATKSSQAMQTHGDWPIYRAAAIARALTVEGAHLMIHPGGCTLSYDTGCKLRTYDTAETKAACLAAGLPVIDCRMLNIDAAMSLTGCPMVAVGEPPNAEPWPAQSSAPLARVAALHRAAGAELLNLPETQEERE